MSESNTILAFGVSVPVFLNRSKPDKTSWKLSAQFLFGRGYKACYPKSSG